MEIQRGAPPKSFKCDLKQNAFNLLDIIMCLSLLTAATLWLHKPYQAIFNITFWVSGAMRNRYVLQVLLWIFDTVLAIVPVESPVLRLARLVRLIRLVKLVRAVQGFDSLIIMTTALKDSP